jgi:two-component system, OmpR family, KDP operon response regulator KdpE
MSARVLLVEDETQIRRFVRLAIEEEACSAIEARSLAEARACLQAAEPDLIILDLGLPDGDGIHFIRSVREGLETPILILSAGSAEDSKIEALDAGADDYLTKPFGVGELRARVRALLRRRKPQHAPPSLVRFGTIAVDLSGRQVFRQGEPVHLTPLEFRLLSALVSHPGQILTQRKLLRDIWGPAYVESSHYLRVYVGHLRQKLEDDPTQPQFFLTETGVGYRFQPDSSTAP